MEQSKANEDYQALLELMSTSESYKLYRQRLKSSAPPGVPYLGLICSSWKKLTKYFRNLFD